MEHVFVAWSVTRIVQRPMCCNQVLDNILDHFILIPKLDSYYHTRLQNISLYFTSFFFSFNNIYISLRCLQPE